MTERPLILVDFDGVLNIQAGGMTSGQARRMHALGWRMGTAWLDNGPEMTCCNPRHGQMLASLASESGAELAWATMREAVATTRCAPLAGLPAMPVIPVMEALYSGDASTKAESVVPWTRGRPFAWFEDRYEECEEADYQAAGQPHLMVRVDPREGLGEEHIEAARQWLASLGREDRDHATAG
jgi:hypothetical protein